MSRLINTDTQVTIRPDGDLVASKVDTLKEQLLCQIDRGTTQIVMDLSLVQRIDAVGLGVLVAAANRLGQVSGKLVICNSSEPILRMLKVMRLDKVFMIEQ